MLENIDSVQIFSAFIIMFAIIDITGSLPIFMNIRKQNKKINPIEATLVAAVMFCIFYFAGEALLRLFSVDVPSFAVAGSFVIFILALEMILGIEIIKNDTTGAGASVVPIAFPLIAGPGALTTFLSLRGEYATINIMFGLAINIVIAAIVLKHLDKVERLLGNNLVFILRKFFGVLLLAIAVKLFATNLAIVIRTLAA